MSELTSQRMTDADSIRTFILGGNSRFTIKSVATQRRFTYRVRKTGDKPAFVQVLTGSDNESDYEFLGSIFYNRYAHGRKSRIRATAPSAIAFDWFIKHLLAGRVSERVEFWHEGRCCRCARALTDPVSINRGYGPECAKHFVRHDFMV
jgi:hypothetical protein